MNGLSNLDETYSEHSPARIDDLNRFRRSKVKVTAGRRGGEGIHVDAGRSLSYSSFSQLDTNHCSYPVAVTLLLSRCLQ